MRYAVLDRSEKQDDGIIFEPVPMKIVFHADDYCGRQKVQSAVINKVRGKSSENISHKNRTVNRSISCEKTKLKHR